MNERAHAMPAGLLAVLVCAWGALAGVGPAAAAGASNAAATSPHAADDIRITAGDVHTCAPTAAGQVKCWGGNTWGGLGDGTTVDRPTPVDVVGQTSPVRTVDAGWNFTCAVATAGAATCWGYNLRGQLGDGTTTNSSTPVGVVGLGSGVTAISAGVFHACALTDRGAVKCWGLNHRGQLGDGTTTDSSTPVDVVGLGSGVKAISAGIWHTCALLADGGVKCWGQNNVGQLGDGTTTDSSTPVDVVGLPSRVSAIDTGTGSDGGIDGSHTCAVTTRGGVLCWGLNNLGQLGDGTTTDSSTPVTVSGLERGARAVATGSGYSCALTRAGGVRCWGYNFTGQLGDGTTTNRSTPVDVVGLRSGVGQLATGGFHACVLTRRGAVKCWGGNGGGQLGDGTTTGRLTPVDVSGSFYRPECPTLVAARHTGFALSQGYAVGSMATFTADSGYALVGSPSLRCRADRSWSGPVPTAAGTGSVIVTPSTGLVDGQSVTVALIGVPGARDRRLVSGRGRGGPRERRQLWRPHPDRSGRRQRRSDRPGLPGRPVHRRALARPHGRLRRPGRGLRDGSGRRRRRRRERRRDPTVVHAARRLRCTRAVAGLLPAVEQPVDERVDERLPRRLDDVLAHADGRPGALAVGRVDQHPRDRPGRRLRRRAPAPCSR